MFSPEREENTATRSWTVTEPPRYHPRRTARVRLINDPCQMSIRIGCPNRYRHSCCCSCWFLPRLHYGSTNAPNRSLKRGKRGLCSSSMHYIISFVPEKKREVQLPFPACSIGSEPAGCLCSLDTVSSIDRTASTSSTRFTREALPVGRLMSRDRDRQVAAARLDHRHRMRPIDQWSVSNPPGPAERL